MQESSYTDCVAIFGSRVPAELSPLCHAAPFLVTVQLFAYVLLHEMVDDFPDCTRSELAEMETVGGGQRESDGVEAEHTPVQEYVPVVVCPQKLGEDGHEEPAFGLHT